MPLSRDFKDLVRERAQHDEAFRIGMLQGALEALGVGDAIEAKILIRDYINATMGFPELAETVQSHPKTLMRQFSAKGNPTLDKLSAVLKELTAREGYVIKVERAARKKSAVRVERKSPSRMRKAAA